MFNTLHKEILLNHNYIFLYFFRAKILIKDNATINKNNTNIFSHTEPKEEPLSITSFRAEQP